MIEAGIDEATITVKPIQMPNTLEEWPDMALSIIGTIEILLRLIEVFGERQDASRVAAHYSDGVSYGSHTFFFCISYSAMNPVQGICVKFSATSLREYRMRYKEITGVDIDIHTILQLLNGETMTAYCSRVDPYVDFIDEDIDITQLHADLIEGRMMIRHANGRKNTSTISCFLENGDVQTLYIGRYRQRNVRIYARLYDKRSEQLHNPRATRIDTAQSSKNWVRFEVVFKNEYARELSDRLLTSSDDDYISTLLSAILGKYRFIDEDGCYQDCTVKMIELAEDIGGFFSVRRESNAELRRQYLSIINHSGLFGFMYQVWRLWGQNGLESALDAFRTDFVRYSAHPSEKTVKWVRQNKEELKDRTAPFGE